MDNEWNNNEAQEAVSALQIKCPSCGGAMMYAPKTRSLQCVYCGVTKPLSVKPVEIHENDYVQWARKSDEEKAKTAQEQSMTAQQVQCDQCGATVVMDSTKSSTKCPYCGTPLILERAQIKRFWQPDYLLPFAIDKKECNALFTKWLNGKWFLPSKYKKGDVVGEKFCGVYYPYWTYDAHTQTSYEGERGTDRRVSVKDSNGKTSTKTVTDWKYVSGTVSRSFDDILVPASKNLPANIIAELKKWPLKSIVPYSPEFTAGFTTDVYTVDFTEGVVTAKKQMESTIDEDIRKDIGGNHQRISGKKVFYSDLMFKLVLLPLWIGIFKTENKSYQFIINGHSGEVHGDYPMDKLKIALVVLGCILLLALLFFIVIALE